MKIVLSLILLLVGFHSHSQLFKRELIGSTVAGDVSNMVSVDVNGDGLKDIVAVTSYPTIGSSNRITWYKNLGDESFKQGEDIALVTTEIRNIFPIDFDQDGKIDIISCTTEWTENGKILFHKNLGNGEFAAPQIINSSNSFYREIYSFDVDNDGDNDIVVCTGLSNESGHIECIENLGNGNFGPPVSLIGPLYNPQVKLIEDLDNNSLIDLIIRDAYGLYSLKNSGNMNFSSTDIYLPIISDFNVFCVDLNLDGNTDILIANNSYGEVPLSWIESVGNGNFNSIQAFNTTGVDVYNKRISAIDFDNDGDLDIVYYTSNQYNDKIEWLENDGFFNFSPGELIEDNSCSSCGRLKFLIDDYNNDGNKDFVLGDPTFNKIDVLYGNQSGGFADKIEVAAQNQHMITTLRFDVNNNQIDDLITVNYDPKNGTYIIAWFKNLQNGEFSGRKIIARINNFLQIKQSDINLDGKIDLLVVVPSGSFNEKIIFYENLGNDTFSAGVEIATANSYDHFVVGDIDNDGDADIIYYKLGDIRFYIQKNQGNLSFLPGQNGPYSPSITSITLSDLDNDGFLDVVFDTGYASIGWFQNNGNGSFNSYSTIVSNNLNNPSQFKLADMDSDNDLDIVYGVDSIFWIENIGSGVFQNTNLILSEFDPESIFIVADIDGDGDLDIISTNYASGKVIWTENNGQGVFNLSHGITTNIINYSSTMPQLSITSFDFDGDGDQEVFIATSDSLMVMRNNIFSPNQVSGTVFYDENQNGIMDLNDYIIPQMVVSIDNGQVFTYSNENGSYNLNLENLNYGIHQVSPEVAYNWQITNVPQTFEIIYNSNFLSEYNINFGIYPALAVDSIETSLTGAYPRCNDTINYWVNIKNVGSSISSGILHLELNDQINFHEASLQPDSVVGNNIYWNFENIDYFHTETIVLQVIMPDFSSIGDTLSSRINSDIYDQLGNSVYHAQSDLDQIVVCAYDPNDKMSFPAKFDPLGNIPVAQEYLDYTIRFQNTGNDTAKVVVIKDQLDGNLIWNSISSISSSHEMNFDIDMNGLASFTFDNIYLPDSSVNFNGSQGFVKFRIGVKPNLYAGTKIYNYGRIYFDQNPAVLTNVRINTIDSIGSSLTSEYYSPLSNVISIYPNPFNNSTTIDFGKDANEIYKLSIFDVYGRKVFMKENISEDKYKILEKDISKGLFIVIIQNDKNEFISSNKIICR